MHLADDQPGSEFTSGRKAGDHRSAGVLLREPNEENNESCPRIGSLFSGYGGLDLAVEEVFDGETVWFSELNEPVARVFAHHWPGAPNLGDITTIDWTTAAPVDILCGGFPCQSVSTVGRRQGFAPGAASGLWAHMATAIDALQPEWVVIENVRGLLTTPAQRPALEGDHDDRRNPGAATGADATPGDVEPDPWGVGDSATRPLTAAAALVGDLVDLRYDAQWIGLPASAIGAPHPRFRVFILAHRTVPYPARLGRRQGRGDLAAGRNATRNDRAQSPDHRPRPPRHERISATRRVGESVEPDPTALRRWGRYAPAIVQWERIIGRPAPEPALLPATSGPRPAPTFVEWLMGLENGWVTDPSLEITPAQQLAMLGNGVVPLQATVALRRLLAPSDASRSRGTHRTAVEYTQSNARLGFAQAIRDGEVG